MIISWPVHTLTIPPSGDLVIGAAGNFRQVPASALAAMVAGALWLAVPVTAAPAAVSEPVLA
jgi:hypothetical protein